MSGDAPPPDDIFQDGPGLFGDEGIDDVAPDDVVEQDGPGLFDDPAEEPLDDPEDSSAESSWLPASAVGAVLNSRRTTPEAPAAPLALYRRYRPDTFQELIGQDHVTVPLQRALDNNKVNHAYLFSGPRGCGKTTSARILARCLNCEMGPTSTPCGVCQSCTDLARGGPGSIDVIEIDAASHGGVDDARDLRERAFFAPVASRYKIYIVDEAHMVTTAGFNALLKLVEEPPPHAKFVFATTEPEKVIGTIRSRTHHYPFRLVPPRILTEYLSQICDTEGVHVDAAALPLVVRAGGGSVRDSLSVLDQLLGGAGEEGVGHEQAAALLGYTPDALLDEIMDAFAAGDGAGVFRTIDKVIEVGQDPRRFAEDLLRRLRDLVILAAVPDAATNGMLEVSTDQAQRLATQVAGMGNGELTRAAEVIATGLTDMRGTTAPRLHLELMCARVLLPGADADERGLNARMDRLERRVGMIGSGEAPVANWDDVEGHRPPEKALARPAPQPQQAPAPQPRQAPAQQVPAEQPPAERQAPAPQAPAPQPAREERPQAAAPAEPTQRPAQQAPSRETAAQPAPAQQPSAPSSPSRPAPAQGPAKQPLRQRPAGAPAAGSAQAPAQQEAPAAARPRAESQVALTTSELRRVWPNVLEEVKGRRRFTYMLLSQNAQVIEVSGGQLVLGFASAGAKENFSASGNQDVLADSLIEVIGVELRIQAVETKSGEQAAAAQPTPAQSAPPPGPPPATRQMADAVASAASASEKEPQRAEADIASDDVELVNADEAAAALLAATFDAQVIDVEDKNAP
ncbi:DNA polymerase III subunit gamma and tau [Tessaracoccus antarcticus]|uniref:DNA polymerase III subunit gamma and tau n=1 Tax=Tessaracoccus antarcticus TaxID=2479848 RepID=UPI00389A9390